MTLPGMPETVAYILRNSLQFGFHELNEDDFADRARTAILTKQGADGRFLTHSPMDFFLSTGGKGGALMRPGSEIRDWGIKKGKLGKSGPLIVIEEDYPGMPIDQVATLVEYQARALHQLEANENRAGPEMSRLIEYPPNLVTTINDGLEDEALERLDKQREMHATYRSKVLKWLRRKTHHSMPPSYISAVGFDTRKGRISGTIRSSSITGIMAPGPGSIFTTMTQVIEIDCPNRIGRPEVAVALDFQADMNGLGFQTLLCSATPRRMLLYAVHPEDHPDLSTGGLGRAIFLQSSLVTFGPSYHRLNRRGVLRGSDPANPITHRLIDPEKEPRRTLLPLSLYILPPPLKTSSKTRGMFSHDVEGMGYAIVPIANDEFTFHYDAHPLAVAYNISKYTTVVSAFLEMATGYGERGPEEQEITIAEDEALVKKWGNHRRRTVNFVEEVPHDEPELTFVLPYGKEVMVHAKAGGSTMIGFTDGSVRTGTIQLKQIDELMDEGESAFLYGRLASLPNIDPQLPKQLLNFENDDWEGVILHLEGEYSPGSLFLQGPVEQLLDANVVPVRNAKGAILPVYQDEIANGDAESLGFVMDGKPYYFVRTYRIAATIIAMDMRSKRFKNGEMGPVLLSVMSEERRARPPGVVERTASRAPLTTVYESIGKTGVLKGFTVEDRRAMYGHLVKFGTHTIGHYLFIDPLEADTIVEVEFTETNLKQVDRFVRQAQMERNTEQYAPDAALALKSLVYTDPVTGESVKEKIEPILPTAQGSPLTGRRRPEFVPSGFASLIQIESAVGPQIVNAKIVGIRSSIPGLTYKVDSDLVLTAKTMYETNEGLVFSTDISLDQFKRNGPEPHIEGDIPSTVEAALTASLNPQGPDAEYSRHRQIEQWRFKREPAQKAIDSESRLRTYKIDHPMVKHFIGFNSRYEGYEGAKVIVAPLRDDLKDNWAVQTILIPKQYGLRRTANEVRLDALEAPKWYSAAHPDYKKPDPADILEAAQPKHRAWLLSTLQGPSISASGHGREGDSGIIVSSPTQRANPPTFDSPEAMQMGIQTDKEAEGGKNTKWHNQRYKGKMSTIPDEANKWKSGTFKNENNYEFWTNHLEEDERPYVVSLKVDGDNALAHFDGEDTVIWNKRGRWRTGFALTDEITKTLKKQKVKSAKIMGELYAVDENGQMLPRNKISSIIVSPKTIERQNQIRFAAFDVIEIDGHSMDEVPYHDRIAAVAGLVGGGKTIGVVPLKAGKGPAVLQEAWEEGMLEPEFEGLILRFDESPGTGKWSFKIKGKGTADLAILGYYWGGSAEFTDDKGTIRRKGHKGGMSDKVGGFALAWINEDGDFIYAGNAATGLTLKTRKEANELLSPHALGGVEGGPVKFGSHWADPTKTHDHVGKGSMTLVKPTMVGEFQYRGIAWGEKPVYRIKGNKLVQVGTTRAPTMQQPSFKGWRRDKDANHQDTRLTQIPEEGAGKWGQIKNPPMGYVLLPDFSPPEGFQ